MLEVIEKHPNYYITDDGVVYRRDRSGLFKLKPDWSNGYARVDIDGTKEYIGKMVLETFGPSKLSPIERLFYIDGDKTNNNIDNLIWLTPSEIKLYSVYTLEYRMQLLSNYSRARE